MSSCRDSGAFFHQLHQEIVWGAVGGSSRNHDICLGEGGGGTGLAPDARLSNSHMGDGSTMKRGLGLSTRCRGGCNMCVI